MTKIAIPTAPSELEEMLGDTAKIQNVIKEGQLQELITAYMRGQNENDKNLGAQIKEQTQLALADMLMQDKGSDGIKRLNQALANNGNGFNAKNALYNRKAPGAKIDDQFEGTADFFQSIWHLANSLPVDAQVLAAKLDKAKKIQNSFGSTVPADGGFLIPETLRSEILQVALENSVVRSRARVIPMETLRVPIPMIDSTSNVSSVFGGIVCYWTEEGASLVESQASFGRVVLEAKKLTGYAEFPNELIADATAFGAFFNQVFPAALAWYEDVAFMTGSGDGEPLGAFSTTNNAIVATAKETNQAAASLVWENIVKMYARMLPSSLNSAVWVASIDTFPELATMALSVGTGGSAVWLNNGVSGPPMTILGRPVIFTEKASVLGTQGDINFVDFGYYLIGDRQVMQAMSSPHYKFASDKTAFRIIERVDGRPWLQSSITPKNNGNALSPFVQLATRS